MPEFLLIFAGPGGIKLKRSQKGLNTKSVSDVHRKGKVHSLDLEKAAVIFIPIMHL